MEVYMNNYVNMSSDEESIYLILESQIKDNQYKSKEELIERIKELKEYGRISVDDSNKKIQTLLDLYDSLNRSDELPLDMDNYKSVKLEDANMIVSTMDDKVIKSVDSDDTINDEFKKIQNNIIANSKDGETNASDVFLHMANYQKEEVTFISLNDVLLRDDIDTEMLKKIRFFIGIKDINPYNYKVDIVNGVFYNPENDDLLEVRKNDVTLEYEVYRNNELLYDRDDYQTKKNNENVKVRKLTLNNNNAAFSKIGFLILNIVTFISVVFMIVFLYK